jgi:hypothetical protein
VPSAAGFCQGIGVTVLEREPAVQLLQEHMAVFRGDFTQQRERLGRYTSHRHNMNFIESLKIQGEKRIKFLLILCVSFAQTVRDRRLEVLECLIISGIQTLSFDELPKPLNQI